MNSQKYDSQLARSLKNRHVQLISLGSTVGTGLFLGIAETIKIAGPAVILGYAIGGFISFLIMRQLAEMVVEEPVAGSFSYFAYKYWGSFAGFVSGWTYWMLYVLVSMTELTAVGVCIQYWWPDIPIWVSSAVFFMIINAINLAKVNFYGEVEFWLTIIKVVAIISMIIFGAYLLFSGIGGPDATVANLWAHGGFLPNGVKGLMMSMAVIMFSFGGLELVGIIAAEAKNPQKSIPKATNQVIYRILIFYVGSLTILLSIYPWVEVVEGASPFVMIFQTLNSNLIATIFNIVVLSAALSAYNSCVYCNSRMLYGLAQQGNGIKILLKVDARGVPRIAIFLSATSTAFCIMINYLIPNRSFDLFMVLVVLALVINWVMISVTHLKFRTAKNREGIKPRFKSLWYPLSNYLCLMFMIGIVVVMFLTTSTYLSVLLLPLWVAILAISYFIKLYSKCFYKLKIF